MFTPFIIAQRLNNAQLRTHLGAQLSFWGNSEKCCIFLGCMIYFLVGKKL